MKHPVYLCLSAYILICSIIRNESSCSPPDVPVGGSYRLPSGSLNKFRTGDEVLYSCDEGHILMGTDTNKCGYNGEWTEPSPFCDPKAEIRYMSVNLLDGTSKQIQNIIESSQNICYTLRITESLQVGLTKKKEIYAVRLLLKRGDESFRIFAGKQTKCEDTDSNYYVPNQWNTFKCKSGSEATQTVNIQHQVVRYIMASICGIEVYQKQDQADGCEDPPVRKVAKGYLKVSRSKATLMCEEGYRNINERLICEKNVWQGGRLQCDGKKEPNFDTQFLAFGVSGVAMVIIIIGLLAAVIHFKKKLKNKEVVVAFQPQADDSGISLYETVNEESQYVSTSGRDDAPELPSTFRPRANL